jgi:hypothetical protein
VFRREQVERVEIADFLLPQRAFFIRPFKSAARLKCTVDLAKSYLELELVFEAFFAVSHL